MTLKKLHGRIAFWFCVSFPFFAAVPVAVAQTTPQKLYGSTSVATTVPTAPSSVVGLTKAGSTGALSLISGSPFNERQEGGPLAIDGQGKFLFVLNESSNNISMFAIDGTSGALTEVPSSPIAVPVPTIYAPGTPPPSQPISIATEPSGKFVFVGYRFTQGPNSQSGIASLSIDISGASPTLTLIELDLLASLPAGQGTPIQLLTDSNGLHLYVGEGIGVGANQPRVGGAVSYTIQPNGHLLGIANTTAAIPDYGQGYAIDPKDRFFYAAGGTTNFISNCFISPIDGSVASCSQSLLYLGTSGSGGIPMYIENTGHFLYIPTGGGSVLVFSIDQTTGALTQLSTLNGIPSFKGGFISDPLGPYVYSTDDTVTAAIHVYQVDSATGNLAEISGSPFNEGIPCCLTLAISGNHPPVAINGPNAAISPSAVSFGDIAVGTSSTAETVSITNNGSQTLVISSVSIVNNNATDFSQTNTCTAPIAPNGSCSVNLIFTPSGPGPFISNLQIRDNAASSPQTIPLNGAGIAPAVSPSPSGLTFTAIAQGTTEGPQTITITNSGQLSLHATTLAISGTNPGDFSQTNNCVGAPIVRGGTCTINVSFTPLASGTRTAMVALSDDAPDSPQNFSLQGIGSAPFQMSAAPSSTTTSTVTVGQTAQYSLQLNPGTGFTGTVSLACTGAPLGAKCVVTPSSLTINSANAAPFSVSISTTGTSNGSGLFDIPPIFDRRLYPVFAAWLAFLLFVQVNRMKSIAGRLAACAALFLSAGLLVASGCGGGSTTTPPLITPKGQYTITVSATSGNLPPQTISLSLTVD